MSGHFPLLFFCAGGYYPLLFFCASGHYPLFFFVRVSLPLVTFSSERTGNGRRVSTEPVKLLDYDGLGMR